MPLIGYHACLQEQDHLLCSDHWTWISAGWQRLVSQDIVKKDDFGAILAPGAWFPKSQTESKMSIIGNSTDSEPMRHISNSGYFSHFQYWKLVSIFGAFVSNIGNVFGGRLAV